MKINYLEKKLTTSTEKFGSTDDIEAKDVRAYGRILTSGQIHANGPITSYGGINTTGPITTNGTIKVGQWTLNGTDSSRLQFIPPTPPQQRIAHFSLISKILLVPYLKLLAVFNNKS